MNKNNVIQMNECYSGSLRFTLSDKQYLNNVCVAFRNIDLPHELVYGLTDEEQEWCLVRKLIYNREKTLWHLKSVIVAEIIVLKNGYRHCGNWGEACAPSLQELFNKLMPSAYDKVRQGVI